MWSRTILAVFIVCAASVVHADDYGWDDGSESGWSDVRPVADYAVSVQGEVTVESFDDALAPYGQWVTVANYGRVWRPSVPAGWRPYYYGRWEWTNEGWLWVSDEPWGWAAYHYGRWTYEPYYGWIWVPGVEWAPAWVSWRVSGDVIGWAPLAPGYSVYVSTYPFIDHWWTFVPCARFVSVPVYSVAYAPHIGRRHFYATAPAPARPVRAIAPGRVVTQAPAWGGPAPRLIEERVGRPVAPARIVAAPAPGARGRPGEIPVYRPEARVAAPRGPGAPGRRDAPALQPAPGGSGRPGPGAVAAPGWGGSARQGQQSGAAGRGPGREGAAAIAPRGDGSAARWGGAPQSGRREGAGVAPAPQRGGGGAAAPGRGGGGGRSDHGGGGGRSERGGARR